ncbi:MAG: helix-turn-helix domain-containing protein [Pirellulales bacterium]
MFEISDPTTVGEFIEKIKQSAVQLESRPLRVRRVIVRLGACVVLFQSTNRAVRTRTVVQEDVVAFVAFGPRAVGTMNGLPVGPDRLVASTPGIEVMFVVEAGYESVTLLVPPADIQSHLCGRGRDGEFNFPHGVELLTPRPAAARELYDWGRRLTELASRQPEVFNEPKVQAAAQVELVEGLLGTLSSAARSESTFQDVTRQAHSQVVRDSEDYVLAHAGDRLYVTDLCHAAGVSERTLQNVFKDMLGITPIAYLTRLRLHRVRQALRVGTHATTTVTAEALRWGFWHFGEFSRAYKECFDELPSDTLRRPPDAAE